MPTAAEIIKARREQERLSQLKQAELGRLLAAAQLRIQEAREAELGSLAQRKIDLIDRSGAVEQLCKLKDEIILPDLETKFMLDRPTAEVKPPRPDSPSALLSWGYYKKGGPHDTSVHKYLSIEALGQGESLGYFLNKEQQKIRVPDPGQAPHDYIAKKRRESDQRRVTLEGFSRHLESQRLVNENSIILGDLIVVVGKKLIPVVMTGDLTEDLLLAIADTYLNPRIEVSEYPNPDWGSWMADDEMTSD